jgi:hypothetical protein
MSAPVDTPTPHRRESDNPTVAQKAQNPALAGTWATVGAGAIYLHGWLTSKGYALPSVEVTGGLVTTLVIATRTVIQELPGWIRRARAWFKSVADAAEGE